MPPIPPSEAQLAPAGAGLPFPENLFVRYITTPLGSRLIFDERANELFQIEGKRVLRSVEGLTEAQLSQRALIPRILGLEDSSRNWSIAMTLEHLVIVGTGIMEVIRSLSAGQVPNVQVDIAKVKPLESTSVSEVLSNFRSLLSRTLESVPRDAHDGAARLAHPWFGLLTSHQWRVLVAIHQRIHRRQLQLIRQGLITM